MKKIWHDEAWEDYIYWQTQDKKTLKRINKKQNKVLFFLPKNIKRLSPNA